MTKKIKVVLTCFKQTSYEDYTHFFKTVEIEVPYNEGEEWHVCGEEYVKHWIVDEDDNFLMQEAYKDGAEFGYNKANEWHYVKDGEYPTHSNRLLVFTDEGVGFGIYGLDNKKWYTYDTGFDVIAWKEIVLPELKESE